MKSSLNLFMSDVKDFFAIGLNKVIILSIIFNSVIVFYTHKISCDIQEIKKTI